jgi:hypothetical protein
MAELIEEKQAPLEERLGDGIRLPENFHESMPPEKRFKVRVIWLLGRLTYEARLWVPATKAGVPPEQALYGSNVPVMLRAIASTSVQVTRTIAGI